MKEISQLINKSMSVLLGMGILFFSLSSLAALTDSAIHAPPSSGTYGFNSFMPGTAGFPVVGGTFDDPIFGSTVKRLTNVEGNSNNDEIYAHHWANANGTFAFHRDTMGMHIIAIATGQKVYTNQPTGIAHFDNFFDALDPDKYYYFSGNNLMRRNLALQTDTVMKVFPAPLQTNGGSLNIQSQNGQFFTVRYANTNKVWDSLNDIIYSGVVTPLDLGGWVSITPDANYMVTAAGPNQEHYSYKIDHVNKSISSTPINFWTLCGDHGVLVSATDGKNYFVGHECYSIGAVYRVDISLNQAGRTPAQQQADNKLLVPLTWNDSGHFSAISKGPLRDWVFYSNEAYNNTDNFNSSTSSWYAFKQEIIAMNVLSGEIRRLAHHRSRGLDSNYSASPRVSCSWDGSVVMWVSNFNKNSPFGYADLYVIQSPLGPAPPPPPPNIPPTVNLTSPTSGASFVAGADITINANATDSDGSIAKVEFYNGSVKLGEAVTAPYSFIWSNFTVGSYSLTAKAFDNLGLVTVSTGVNITITAPPPDTQPPLATIISPAANTSIKVNTIVNIKTQVTDNVGVVKVEFYVNGVRKFTDTKASDGFSYAWKSGSKGSKTLQIKAYDAAGNMGASALVIVNVQ